MGPKKPLCDLLVVVVINSLKIPKTFLIHSAAQCNKTAYTFLLIFPTDLPAQIFSCRNAIISGIKVLFMLPI